METDDGELVGQTLMGSRDAFAALVDRYRDAVCAVAYSHLGNFEDVQDAAQDAFVQAYRRLAQLREPAKFGPWLRRITTNICMGMLRRSDHSVASLETAPEVACPSSAGDPHERAASLIVRDALSRIPENARITLTLFHIDGYSHSEIADFLEVPVNTVRSRLRSARKRLSREMIDMFTDQLSEDKKKVRITNEYVLYRDDLTEQTGRERIDDFLYMLVNILRAVTKDRLRSVFLTGDYASGKVAPRSRLDLTIFMKDEIDSKEDDMRRAWSIVVHMATYAKLRLGGVGLSTFEAYQKPSVQVPGNGYMPGAERKDMVKNHSLLLWGEDVRPLVVLDDVGVPQPT